MLGLLLLILKIIGITLAALIGLIIALALIILLVPVRFRARGSYYDTAEGSARITWLMHLILVQISYRDQLEVAVRILGFKLFKEKGGEAKEDLIENPVLSAQEFAEDVLDPKLDETVQSVIAAPPEETPEETPKERLEETPEAEIETEEEKQKETEEEKRKEKQEEAPAVLSKNKRKKKKRRSFIIRFFSRVRERLRRLKLTFRILSGRVKILWHKKEKLAAFLKDEKNQKTFHLVKKQLFALIRHVRPRTLKGRLTFGLEDPYLMGRILTGAALFYPLYHESLNLTPVFEQKILEGELSLKGRIRLGTLLVIGLRLLIHKNFRVLLKRFLNQGGN